MIAPRAIRNRETPMAIGRPFSGGGRSPPWRPQGSYRHRQPQQGGRSWGGGIKRDSFNRYVRRRVSIRNIGDRPFVEVDSLRAYARSGTKPLK